MTDKKDIQEFAPAVVPVATTAARFGAGQMLKAGAAAAGAAAAFSPKVKRFVSHSLGLDKTPEQSAASLDKAAEKLGIKTPSPSTPAASTPAAGGSPTTPAEKDTPKAVETTKAVDKPVSVVKTKGGDYNVYDKGSEKAADFRKTYADAKGNFEWEGRKYAKPSSEPTKSTESNKPESESGGKKKKMSEETNPLIAAFLKLQSENPSNMFEAAKKAKKDYDKDGKVESPKDEVWGSRFRAAKAAGKMEEEEQVDEGRILRSLKPDEDPQPTPAYAKKIEQEKHDKQRKKINRANSVHMKMFMRTGEKHWLDGMKEEVEEIDEISGSTLGSYIVKSKKDENARRERGVKIRDEMRAQTGMKFGTPFDRKLHSSKASRGAGQELAVKKLTGKAKVSANEEVEFSQAEIDHINSFFEAVAPSRAEPTKGVNPTVRNTDLTDETLEEGRPKKNPTPETTERDARQHIQVQAGRAAGGSVVEFKHDNGKISKLTPGMGRSITAHLNGLKPAERQAAVKRMHASPEGLKV